MFLVFDTETTGIPKRIYGKYPDPNDANAYTNSRVIELSWCVYDKGKNIVTKSSLIKYNGVISNSHIHNISEQMVKNDGRDIEVVLNVFEKYLDMVDKIIAHNIKFDFHVLAAEILKCGKLKLYEKLCNKRKKDTMLMGCVFLNLNKKFIKLQTLYHELFPDNKKELFTDKNPGHRSLVDVKACALCYFHMISRKK